MRSILLIMLLAPAACTPSTHTEADRLDCNSCHAAEFDTTPHVELASCTPTDHVARGFSRTCYECHGTASWCPADDSHVEFDITANNHHGGFDCADCHLGITYEPPAITDSSLITCTNCHWHTKARTDPWHLANGDYTYTPSSCLECHGEGGE